MTRETEGKLSLSCQSFRKERKIFEAHQQEVRASRDKKDKEDIETLRREVCENSLSPVSSSSPLSGNANFSDGMIYSTVRWRIKCPYK